MNLTTPGIFSNCCLPAQLNEAAQPHQNTENVGRENINAQPPRHEDMSVSYRGERPAVSPMDNQSVSGVQSVTPEQTKLVPAEFHFTHHLHGAVSIKREAKTMDQNNIMLTITLGSSVYRKQIYISNSDDSYQGQSTLGYSDIDFPDAMINKGISHLFHYAAVDAAERMGVDKFVIASVVSDTMHRVCERLKMNDDGAGFGHYSGKPQKVKDECDHNMRRKGWGRRGVTAEPTVRMKVR